MSKPAPHPSLLVSTMRFATPIVALLAIVSAVSAQPKADPKQIEFFETKVRPVFAEFCKSCHGPEKQKAGIRVDTLHFLLKGNEEGPAIVPGKPDQSRLVQAIRHVGDVKMPSKKLPDAVIADIVEWVKQGAAWPDDGAKVADAEAWRKHWAFQPVQRPATPKVKDAAKVSNAIDAFIQAKLEARSLTPNPIADRRTLIRRLKFDLLGLPPTMEEVEAFEKDTAPDAYAKLVDRLLASPHYGERWARYWLDVARYADNKGYVFQEERRYPYAYAYRDWVVKSFNDDLPFDQFVMQQLAADRLVAKGEAPVSAQAGMGYLTVGRRFLNNIHDIIDDRLDVVGRGLMGITVSCARCHDHKFDPIPMADYYSLYGVFASSDEPKDGPLIGEPERTPEFLAFEKKVGDLQGTVEKFKIDNKKELDAKNRKFRDELMALQKKVDAFKASSPFAPPRAMILQDRAQPVEPRLFLRGNPNNPGAPVKRQFLQVAMRDKREPFKEGSGRLEMARAIVSKDNPLTARVFVNRVWLHHFGAGLVTTPSDFGVRTDPPSHPELLDWLAAEFMESGWSIKKLHRLMVTSQAYQRTSVDHPQATKFDPENRLLARANGRRLDFEAMRDSLLAASGRLDPKIGGPAVDILASPFPRRRTLYGFIDRQNLPGVFRTFDFASPDLSSPQRFQTTVPQQALYFMNHPFVHEQARWLVKRPEVETAKEPAEKVRQLYRVIYARNPDADELKLAEAFLQMQRRDLTRTSIAAALTTPLGEWERYAQTLLASNEFLFVD